MLNFTVEIRVDVRAESVNEAILLARNAVKEGEGTVTAVFDEDFDEVDGHEEALANA